MDKINDSDFRIENFVNIFLIPKSNSFLILKSKRKYLIGTNMF